MIDFSSNSKDIVELKDMLGSIINGTSGTYNISKLGQYLMGIIYDMGTDTKNRWDSENIINFGTTRLHNKMLLKVKI